MNAFSSFLGLVALHHQSYKENLLRYLKYSFLVSACALEVALFFHQRLLFSYDSHLFLLLQLLSQISFLLKTFLVCSHIWFYFTPQVDFSTLLHLCSNFVVNFTFSFPYPSSSFCQIIKSQRSCLPFKVLIGAGALLFLFLCCTQRMECKYFPSREILGRRMSFSVADDLYSGFNVPLKLLSNNRRKSRY